MRRSTRTRLNRIQAGIDKLKVNRGARGRERAANPPPAAPRCDSLTACGVCSRCAEARGKRA